MKITMKFYYVVRINQTDEDALTEALELIRRRMSGDHGVTGIYTKEASVIARMKADKWCDRYHSIEFELMDVGRNDGKNWE